MATIAALAAVAVVVQSAAAKPPGSFVGRFHKIKTVASTVPSNGDVNPYGVAVAPVTKGHLVKGDVLISNFNNKKNLQGTGKTIVEISPAGKVSLFASLHVNKLPGACPGGLGLTTALVALKSGWVVVGSLPTKDGSSATAKAGCLIVLNSSGKPVKTIAGKPINGPWDMTALDQGGSADLFVTNVLNGTVAASPKTVNRGTVVRIDLRSLNGHSPKIHSETVIGKGSRSGPIRLRWWWGRRGSACRATRSTSPTAQPTGSRRSRTRLQRARPRTGARRSRPAGC